MNVLQFIDEIPEQDLSSDTWLTLLEMRRDTFRGFASVEKEKGFVQPTVSFHTSRGQEMVRLLAFRVIEEMTESTLATDPIHQQEEVIDALNYLLSLAVLDSKAISLTFMATELALRSEKVFSSTSAEKYIPGPLDDAIYIKCCKLLTGELCDCLRNRAWMQQTQDPYFSRPALLADVIHEVATELIATFVDWNSFHRMYCAKDAVLQFRLRSHY